MHTEYQIGIHIDLPEDVSYKVASLLKNIGINHPSGELDPHITLYYAKFNPNKFEALLHNLATKKLKSTKIVLGKVVCSNSAMNNKFYSIKINNPEPLHILHKNVIEIANKLRGGLLREKDVIRRSNGELNSQEIEYLELYGSYRVLDNFHPHVTLGTLCENRKACDSEVIKTFASLEGEVCVAREIVVGLFVYDNQNKILIGDSENRKIALC